MARFYSASTGGFYDDRIHSSRPDDAVPVSEVEYEALFSGQSAGRRIASSATGRPVLENVVSDDAAVAAAARAQRDVLLTACDWTQVADAPLDENTKALWATYRQALRDVTGQAGFPSSITWPTAPDAT